MPAFDSRLPLDVYRQIIHLAALDEETRQDTLSSLSLVHSAFRQPAQVLLRQHADIIEWSPFRRRILRQALYPAQRKTNKAHWKQALDGLRSVNLNLWESYWPTYREELACWEQHEPENKLFHLSLTALKSCSALRRIVVEDVEGPGAGDEFFDEVLSWLPGESRLTFHMILLP
jgi:hypothetical protein